MGTRCLTILHDDYQDYDGEDLAYANREIAVLYRQYDGYPEGHGEELVNFIRSLDGGYNGASCLMALIVSHFKGDKPYNFYLYRAGTRNTGEDYTYHVLPRNGRGVKVICINDYTQKSTVLLDWKPIPERV